MRIPSDSAKDKLLGSAGEKSSAVKENEGQKFSRCMHIGGRHAGALVSVLEASDQAVHALAARFERADLNPRVAR